MLFLKFLVHFATKSFFSVSCTFDSRNVEVILFCLKRAPMLLGKILN